MGYEGVELGICSLSTARIRRGLDDLAPRCVENHVSRYTDV